MEVVVDGGSLFQHLNIKGTVKFILCNGVLVVLVVEGDVDGDNRSYL
jgi:hypothetical protein